jgi:serine phosphatase RsbU (regulator of sigma subunit)
MNDGAKVQDGMDGALIVVNKHTNVLQYSGANIQYVCYRGGEEIVFRPTRNPIGLYPAEIPFQQQEMVLQKGDMIYLSSDGYYSQFGGPRNTLMKTSGYKRILRSFQGFDIPHQRQIIEENFFAWKGNVIQTDDVLVIGLQV